MLRSCIQCGRIMHRRHKPSTHGFVYPIFMSLLDTREIEKLFKRSKLWSINRFNLVSFYRKDYISGGDTIESAVQKKIYDSTGKRFGGQIFILTHMRYLGFCFNPVTFYFCYENDDIQPQYIIAEINNTPWNERHCYVLENSKYRKDQSFKFGKEFHVSPFMSMDLDYHWRFDLEQERLNIRMELFDGDELCFEAGLDLEALPFNASQMYRVPLRYPFMTLSVVFRIYWQAFQLWVKRTPFHAHPKHPVSEAGYERRS